VQPVERPSDEAQVVAVERWFVRQGLPHFIDDYSAARDILTRAIPILTLIFVLEMFNGLNLEWVWWANVAALLGSLAILVGVWAAINIGRGRAPLTRPDSVGPLEISVFVFVPALLPLIFGGQWASAVTTMLANALLLGLIYVVTSYGMIPMTRWALGRMVRQFTDIFDLFARALPLLLVFATLLFLTAEVWQVSAALQGGFFWAILALFLAFGTLFIIARLPREMGELSTFSGSDEIRELVADTPAEPFQVEAETASPPLGRRQWGNVGMVLLFSQGVQVLVVATLIGIFFVVFGALAIDLDIVQSWTGVKPDQLFDFTLGNHTVTITLELLKVSGFLAMFSGFYFAVYAVTDATFREEFYLDVVSPVRRAFAVRAVYLAANREP
jgi:hypothetical protein